MKRPQDFTDDQRIEMAGEAIATALEMFGVEIWWDGDEDVDLKLRVVDEEPVSVMIN